MPYTRRRLQICSACRAIPTSKHASFSTPASPNAAPALPDGQHGWWDINGAKLETDNLAVCTLS